MSDRETPPRWVTLLLPEEPDVAALYLVVRAAEEYADSIGNHEDSDLLINAVIDVRTKYQVPSRIFRLPDDDALSDMPDP